MTIQDDLNQNESNPLWMCAESNGNLKGRLDYEEADLNITNVMRWGGPYDPERPTYYKNEVVRDGVWTMVANKPTADRPGPQDNGDPSFDLGDVPGFTDGQHTGVVWTGHVYTANVPGFIQRLEAWVPFISGNTSYRFLTGDFTDPANPVWAQLSTPGLVANAWNVLAVPRKPVNTGTQFAIVIDALDSGSSSVVTGGWSRAVNNNTDTDPGNALWNTQNNLTRLRINKTDADATDRATELLGMVTGTTVRFASTVDPALSMGWTVNENPVDAGTYVLFPSVTYSGPGAGGECPVGSVTTMTADVPVASSTRYSELAGHWPANNPSWGSVEGVKEFDGVDQPGAALNAYGIRVEFQPAFVSPDWDLVSLGN